MLASDPASMVNQKQPDLGIPNRFNLNSLRFRLLERHRAHLRAWVASSGARDQGENNAPVAKEKSSEDSDLRD
jgi:hypothetical protein